MGSVNVMSMILGVYFLLVATVVKPHDMSNMPPGMVMAPSPDHHDHAAGSLAVPSMAIGIFAVALSFFIVFGKKI